ncbi:MAG: adenosine deaminase [Ignavibacteriaceae bacterium]
MSIREMKTDKKFIRALPKVELHIHLDCSVSYEVVKKLWPSVSEEEYRKRFIGPDNCTNLRDFLKCVSNGIDLMQTETEIREVVNGLFHQLQQDNVIYAEIRFAPLLHLNNKLLPEEVVEIAVDAVRVCSHSTGIKAGIILCTLRHFSEEQNLQTIKLVEQFINTNVVAFDIAGDEAGYPVDAHKKAFEYAIKKNIPVTAHAGEAKGADSVWETLKYFNPQRIGHGVRSTEDARLIEYVIKNNIHLEVCPTSNILTGIYRNYSEHPVNHLFNAGVSIGINTDGRSLINVSLTDEYIKLAEAFNWQGKHFYACNINALNHTFLPGKEKEEFKKVLDGEYLEIINNYKDDKNEAVV